MALNLSASNVENSRQFLECLAGSEWGIDLMGSCGFREVAQNPTLGTDEQTVAVANAIAKALYRRFFPRSKRRGFNWGSDNGAGPTAGSDNASVGVTKSGRKRGR